LFFGFFTGPAEFGRRGLKVKTMNRMMLEFAFQLAKNIEAKAVLLYADMIPDQHLVKAMEDFQIILVTKGAQEVPKSFLDHVTVLNVPDVNLTRIGQVKIQTRSESAHQHHLARDKGAGEAVQDTITSF